MNGFIYTNRFGWPAYAPRGLRALFDVSAMCHLRCTVCEVEARWRILGAAGYIPPPPARCVAVGTTKCAYENCLLLVSPGVLSEHETARTIKEPVLLSARCVCEVMVRRLRGLPPYQLNRAFILLPLSSILRHTCAFLARTDGLVRLYYLPNLTI